jgi:enoyl-CoA hydratase/carnithine racemase
VRRGDEWAGQVIVKTDLNYGGIPEMELAQRLAEGPAAAYAVAKDLMNASAGFDRLDLHLDRELQELTRAADGPEVAEGLAAFLEKRSAVYA